jgi:hypothetical protein
LLGRVPSHKGFKLEGQRRVVLWALVKMPQVSRDQGGGKRRSITIRSCGVCENNYAMDIVDYLAIDFLTACMLVAAAQILPRRKLIIEA